VIPIYVVHFLQQLDQVVNVNPRDSLFVGVGHLIDASRICRPHHDIHKRSFEIRDIQIATISPFERSDSSSAGILAAKEQILCSGV
jgi:hypothetical protein